jgi:hypothetical protein
MLHHLNAARHLVKAFVLIILCLSFSVENSFAGKAPKTYPEEGKVVGIGSAEHYNRTHSHLYKVETATTLFLLDCGTRLGFSGGECGGEKKLQIGDVIHFRVEKEWAYIAVTQTSTNENGTEKKQAGEQKLRIVREELLSGTQPDKNDAATPQAKQ